MPPKKGRKAKSADQVRAERRHAARLARQQETPEKRERRLEDMRQHAHAVRESETREEREARLIEMRTHEIEVIAYKKVQNETPDKREVSLAEIRTKKQGSFEQDSQQARGVRMDIGRFSKSR